MTRDKKHIDFQDLIIKYLSGNADNNDIELLEKWVHESEDNKKLFKSLKKAWILSGIQQNIASTDINKEWNNISDKLFNEQNKKVRTISKKSYPAIGMLWKYAAAIIIILTASVLIYQNFYSKNYTKAIAKNEVLDNRLPDGSTISLNRNSVIKYVPDSNNKTRQVKLEGDAFFKVKRDTLKPFIVSAQKVKIEVLGTSFYVDARKNLSNVYVYVKSGKVSVSADNKKVILNKSEYAIYNKKDKILIKKQNKNENYLAWKTGIFVFEKARLNEVVFELNRKFKTQILFANPSLKNCEITATFSNKSIDSILKIIEQTLHINFSKEGDKIILSGNRCD